MSEVNRIALRSFQYRKQAALLSKARTKGLIIPMMPPKRAFSIGIHDHQDQNLREYPQARESTTLGEDSIQHDGPEPKTTSIVFVFSYQRMFYDSNRRCDVTAGLGSLPVRTTNTRAGRTFRKPKGTIQSDNGSTRPSQLTNVRQTMILSPSK